MVWSLFFVAEIHRCVSPCISGIPCVRLYSLPWWTCWQKPWRRRGPPGSGRTWWRRAVARRASLGAAAGERRRRGKETGRLSSRNPPSADTAALTGVHELRRPERGQTGHMITNTLVLRKLNLLQVVSSHAPSWWSVVSLLWQPETAAAIFIFNQT